MTIFAHVVVAVPVAIAVLANLSNCSQVNDSRDIFIGTYTHPGESKGIYHLTLDERTGRLSQPELVAISADPSYLAIHPNGKFIYAVHESSDGLVSAYAIEADKKLRLLNTELAKGAAPCHLSVDPSGKYLYTASYGGGTVGCLPIRADGSLGIANSNFVNVGRGTDKSRQEAPHLHFVQADPLNRLVYACDLGTDEILSFTLESKTGKLVRTSGSSAKVSPGGGPRHIAFHPNGKYAYVNSEMGLAVTTFRIDPHSGHFGGIQTLPTLRPDTSRPGKSTAEIECTPDGRFVYVSNRSDESIAVFRVAEDGKLTLVEIEPAGVREPRGFGIDPTGKWLVVAGQHSHDLTVLRINSETGRLTPTGFKVSIANPVCVVFTRP